MGQVTTHTPVPSLREIQSVLVAVGDKPESHAGSRDWIGTFEACIALDHLYGVSMSPFKIPLMMCSPGQL